MEEKEVIVEKKNALIKFFDNKYVKLVESGLLVGTAYVLIAKVGMPADFVGVAIGSLAAALGIDGIATAIAGFTKKKDEKATEVN